MNDLLLNIDKIHTTSLSATRIKKNLKINTNIVNFCKNKIKDKRCNIYKQGKNWYCEIDNIRITINSSSYTIITAHILYKKIYIIGPVGSGKTTLSKNLSNKYNINSYELDKIVWDDEHGNVKRSNEEVLKLFNEILKKDCWIIEDVGREKFEKGRIEADIIYYIKITKLKCFYRVIKRWIKQKLKIEKYNYFPDFKQLLYNLLIVNSYFKKEKKKILSLRKYNNKLVFINKDI